MNQPKNKNTNRTVVYRNVRDPVINDATTNPPSIQALTTDSSGNLITNFPFAPLGVTSVVLSSPSGGGTVTVNPAAIAGPKLPWLYNTAKNFERFRVTRAVLIVVGNLGQTVTGRIMLGSTTDFNDLLTATNLGASSGNKIFDLSSLASREARFNMDVDTAWKKCSAGSLVASPLYSNLVLSVGTMNDQLFTCSIINVSSGPASTNVGNMFLEYDVEFKDPIAWQVNV
jgi:hypothetical protein